MILIKYSLVDKLLPSDAEPLLTAVQRIHQTAQLIQFYNVLHPTIHISSSALAKTFSLSISRLFSSWNPAISIVMPFFRYT